MEILSSKYINVNGSLLDLSVPCVMEKMNGSLMLDDKYTEGCRFVLTLPIK